MRRVVAVLASAIMLVFACDKGPSGPVAGTLKVSLATAEPNARALLLRITSVEAITNVNAARSELTVFVNKGPSSTTVGVFGPLTAGPVLSIDVPDVNKLASYTASVLDAADANNALKSAALFTLRVER